MEMAVALRERLSLSKDSMGYKASGAKIPMAAGYFMQNHAETRTVA